MTIKTPPIGKKIALALVAVVAVATVGWYSYANLFSPQPATEDSAGVDHSPATNSDRELADQIKQDQPNNPSSTPSTPPANGSVSKRQVTPLITAWDGTHGDFKLNGRVPGIIETDGTCTLTLTREDKNVSTSKGALQNVQDTTCGQLVISRAKLSPGDWKAILSYSSPTYAGSSNPEIVEVK